MHRHTTGTGGEPKGGTGLKENKGDANNANKSREQDQGVPCLVMLLEPGMIEKPL